METEKVKQLFYFRPHHFLCAICFQGKGYSSAFINNFQNIMKVLQSSEGDPTKIKVVGGVDDICKACPERENAACTKQNKVMCFDNLHGEAFDIKIGMILTWQEAKTKISNCITQKKFHKICESCAWKKLGICESVIKQIVLQGNKI